jgi:hypothetical protein
MFWAIQPESSTPNRIESIDPKKNVLRRCHLEHRKRNNEDRYYRIPALLRAI